MEQTTQVILDTAKLERQNKSLAERMADRQQHWSSTPERSAFDTLNREIIQYARRDLSQYLDSAQSKGEKRGTSMYTDHVCNAVERAADALCGNVFAPDGWFGYEIDDRALRENDDIQNWLQACTDYMRSVYAQANFDSVMPCLAMDALSLGEGILFAGTDKGRDSAYPQDEHAYLEYCELMAVWFIRDRWGRIIAAHRRRKFSAAEAYERWGTDCGDDLVKSAEGNRPADEYSFLQCVYKRDDPILQGVTRLENERPYVEFWIQEDSDKNRYALHQNYLAGILEQGGYGTMPFIDWPYMLKSYETYGRGALGLVTAKRLHAEHKVTMLAGQRGAEPPLLASKALENQLHIEPAGVTWKVQETDTVQEIYQRGPRYDWGVDMLDRLEREVDASLQLDLFLAMTFAPNKEFRMEEVSERIGEKAAALRPRLQLLNAITLEQLHARMWDIEASHDRLPPPPGVLREAEILRAREARERGRRVRRLGLNVNYKGPLSQIQESLILRRRLMGPLLLLDSLFKIEPEAVTDRIDVAKATEIVLDKADFMQDAMRSDEEVAARQRARAQVQAELAQSEIASKASGALKNTAQAAAVVAPQQGST